MRRVGERYSNEERSEVVRDEGSALFYRAFCSSSIERLCSQEQNSSKIKERCEKKDGER